MTKDNAYKPIYLIYSAQSFLVEEAVGRLKRKLCKNQSLDYFEFDTNTAAEEVINAARMVSLNLSKKIIVYKNADKLKKADIDILKEYFSKPNDLSILVLTIEKKDLKNPLVNLAIKNKYFFEYKTPRGSQVVNWIIERAGIYGSAVKRDAAECLLELVGDNLRVLSNEIEKLSIYCMGREIRVEDVSNSVSNSRFISVFDLVDAIGRKEAASALITLNKVILEGEPPLKIFAMINRQFRLIFETKLLIEKGVVLNEVAKTLRLPSFAVSKYLSQGRNFTDEALKKIYELMADTDYRLKSGGSSLPAGKAQKLVLERMIAECVNV